MLQLTPIGLEAEALDAPLTVFYSPLTALFNRVECKTDAGRLSSLPALEVAALRINRLAVTFVQALAGEQRAYERFIRSVLALLPHEQFLQAVDTLQKT